MADPEVGTRSAQIAASVTQSMQRDVFELFTRAAQAQAGVTINQAAVDAVNAQMQ